MCLRSPFPRLQRKLNYFLEEGWILFSFWFLPSYGCSSGLCELCLGWNLCWVFVCLFFLLWARLNEVVIMSADDWVCIFVLCVIQMKCHTQAATGGWVMLGLVFKWFPLCEFSLFDYSLGLVLWYSRVWESVLPLQRLRAWSLVRNKDSTSGFLWH